MLHTQEIIITEAIQLSQILRGLLSTELGTFRNGMTSIWVEPPQIPQMGAGLQCAISRYPRTLTQVPIVSGQANQLLQWSVSLTQFDLSIGGLAKLDSACAKIRSRFPRFTERPSPFVEGDFVRTNFLLTFPNTINRS